MSGKSAKERRRRMDQLEREMLEQRELVEERRLAASEEREERAWEDGVVVNGAFVRKPDLRREGLCSRILTSVENMTAVATQLGYVLAVSDEEFELVKASARRGTLDERAEAFRVKRGWRVKELINEVFPMAVSVIFGEDLGDDDESEKKTAPTLGGDDESSTDSRNDTDGPSGKSNPSRSTGSPDI